MERTPEGVEPGDVTPLELDCAPYYVVSVVGTGVPTQLGPFFGLEAAELAADELQALYLVVGVEARFVIIPVDASGIVLETEDDGEDNGENEQAR